MPQGVRLGDGIDLDLGDARQCAPTPRASRTISSTANRRSASERPSIPCGDLERAHVVPRVDARVGRYVGEPERPPQTVGDRMLDAGKPAELGPGVEALAQG